MKEFESYKAFWDQRAATPEDALAAIDGSSDETIIRRTGRFAAGQVVAALDIQPADHVLELGCGVGRIGRELASECGHWCGADISGRMLDHAARRLAHLDNVSFRKLTRSDLGDIPSASIDKAYSIAVLCHLDKEDLFLYFEELHRVLKSGGLIFVDTWNLASPAGWKRWQYEVRYWQKSRQLERKDVARNQFCTPDEFRLYLERAGFGVAAFFDNAHWLQAVAGKDLAPHALEEQAARLESLRAEIVFSDLFVQMFEKTIDVIYGQLHPREALRFLDTHKGSREETLFRPFIRGLWDSNSAQWGEPGR